MQQLNGRIKTTNPGLTGKMPVIGNLKIGEKKKNAQGKEYPSSTDYFIPKGKYADLFVKQFGDKCSKITIAFISDNINEVCNQRYELWDGTAKRGYGDGAEFFVYNTTAKDYVKFIGTESEREKLGKWDMILTLRFLIIDITGIIGVWQLDTKARASSIPQIIESFDFVMNNAGRVRGIPFDLQVEKVKSYKPTENGKPHSVYPVLKLIPNISQGSIEKLQQFANSDELNKTMVLTEAKINQLHVTALPQSTSNHFEEATIIKEEEYNEEELLQIEKAKTYLTSQYDDGTVLLADKKEFMSKIGLRVKDERLLNKLSKWIDSKANKLEMIDDRSTGNLFENDHTISLKKI